MSEKKAIQTKGLCKQFAGNTAVDSVELSLDYGELLAIIGPSGSGKTTLLRMLDGLLKPDSGRVFIQGKELSFANETDLGVRRKMAFLPQHPVMLKQNVAENVAYPLRLRGEKSPAKQVKQSLKRVRLLKMANRRASSLSTGEKQRLAFARATVFEPEILLLDEFTSHLDPSNIKVLEDAITGYLRDQTASIIMITHNLFQARRLAATTGLLIEGKIIEKDSTQKIFEKPKDQRTKAFVSGDMLF